MHAILTKELKQMDAQNIQPYWTPLFDEMKDVVIFIDEYFNILKSNRAWNSLGYNMTLSVIDYLYSMDRYLFVKEVQEKKSVVLQLRFINQQSQPAALAWFSIKLEYVEVIKNGKKLSFWLLMGTEQTQIIKEKSLIDAPQRMLKGMLNRLPMMLYHSRNNLDWTMEYVSEGCQQLTGYEEKQLLNTPLYGQLIYPEDRQSVWDNIQLALEQHRCFHIYYRLMHANGELRKVQEMGQGSYSKSGMVLGIDGFVFEI